MMVENIIAQVENDVAPDLLGSSANFTLYLSLLDEIRWYHNSILAMGKDIREVIIGCI